MAQLLEQHWPFEEHRPHCGVHPPAGEHRFVAMSQMPEQQSLLEPQISSTWRVHFILSFSGHIGSEPHRPPAGPPVGHSPEQQSDAAAQTSPATLQP